MKSCFMIVGVCIVLFLTACACPNPSAGTCVASSGQYYQPTEREWLITKLNASRRIPYGCRPYDFQLTFREGDNDDQIVVMVCYRMPEVTNGFDAVGMALNVSGDVYQTLQAALDARDSMRGEWARTKASFQIYVFGKGLELNHELLRRQKSVAWQMDRITVEIEGTQEQK